MNDRSPFTFLEAANTVAVHKGGRPYYAKICMSGTHSQLEHFIRAEGAVRGVAISLSALPFGTLQQYLHQPVARDEDEIFLLCPWDLVEGLDWRLGIPSLPLDPSSFVESANAIIKLIKQRQPKAIFYLPAPLPPVGLNPISTEFIDSTLSSVISASGIPSLMEGYFDIRTYLTTGCPISSAKLGEVASFIARNIFAIEEPKKVLVTDLDETLWAGILGEDGVDGINANPEGVGFKHFLYQTFLRKLKNSGVILAVVSRNDQNAVSSALKSKQMVLSADDFAVIFASYQPKSAQILEISQRFNLTLDQFVFVDDNQIELEEVKCGHQKVVCLSFPKSEDGILPLFKKLHQLFRSNELTAEDQRRTELYQIRSKGITPVAGKANDITSYLAGLAMELTIFDRSHGDRTRAVQLINKTNQFNLNGVRWSDEEIGEYIMRGGRLYTAFLADSTGEHGEILAALIGPDGAIEALVLSCRVFQRRIEYAFLLWLIDNQKHTLTLLASRTEKNEPFWQFLNEPCFNQKNDHGYCLDSEVFQQQFASVLSLFRLTFKEK